MPETVFFRLLAQDDKADALEEAVAGVRKGHHESSVARSASPDRFRELRDAPFAYWVEPSTLSRFAELPTLEPEAGSVRQGLSTSDNQRFVRAIWEVSPEGILVHGRSRPKGGRQERHKWAFLVMTGASQPWYSPITVLVKWGVDGDELRSFKDQSGKRKAVLRNRDFYFRPGFSWTRRAVRFIPYAIPSGCIPTASRYMGFPHTGREFEVLGIAASNVATGFLRFYGEWFTRPNYLVDNLKALPWVSPDLELRKSLESLIRREVARRRRAYQNHEPFHDFTAPALCFPGSPDDALAYDPLSLLGNELDAAVARAYGLGEREQQVLERDLREAAGVHYLSHGEDEEADEETDNRDFVLLTDAASRYEALLSCAVGCAFGRWDLRIALNSSLAPKLADPFAPLPVCSPGMLVGPDGLPAKRDGIVSEAWLRARPDTITFPPEGAVDEPTIPDEQYPLRVAWDGILVDDPDHPDDVVRRVREVLELLWSERAEAIEQEACELLGVKSLREYFRNSRRFFDHHIKRYSKSGRRAPIYWLLQSDRRNYGLWLYYHRLDQDTLFKALQGYVNPKLAREEQRLSALERAVAGSSASGAAKRQQERQLDDQRELVQEIARFAETLRSIANLQLTPDLDDGVLLSIASLYPLVPWSEAKRAWQELMAGKYTWSTMSKRMQERGLVQPNE
jgi:hypothetical protein